MKKPTMKSKSKPFVIVRTYAAGVHTGTLEANDGKTVKLSNARRVWRWSGANTLHEMSLRGVDDTYSRISEAVPEVTLLAAIEIIPCSKDAQANLERSRWGA